ncbi:MAG: beta-ketoacyl-ACP synthase III [Cellulosilyticaceae bacterium]
MSGVKITGVGKATPKTTITNDDLSRFMDTSDEWIRSRTGIGSRCISNGETTSDLAISAAREALADADIDPALIDRIIVATISPNYVMPSTACIVQSAIGAVNATAFDISAACSGFVFGARLATEAIMTGACKHVLVIGAEVLSKTVDWTDRSTCVLFGDGAGAAIFSYHHENHILKAYSGSNGDLGMVLTLPGKPLNNCLAHQEVDNPHMYMDGREVYKFATTVVPISIMKVLEDTPYTLDDIACVILHQANARIMDSVAKKLGTDSEKFYKNVHQYGNTSAASIPIALAEAKAKLKPGDKVILCGFGGGLTWGSMLIEW